MTETNDGWTMVKRKPIVKRKVQPNSTIKKMSDAINLEN